MSAPRHRRHPSAAALTALAFLLFASASVTTTTDKSPKGAAAAAAAAGSRRIAHNSWLLGEPLARRWLLAGPGSSPPTCKGKCGKCTPCKAEHLPIHPGLSRPLEYYPEAWFCKCGNKLYNP
ncbi:hypothetical protein BT93_K1979 [Corymbia citriodora subsp. variegata]|nr:hypothetical protein BT93_K1979 [Corymbia citriodora subsp. variegata]